MTIMQIEEILLEPNDFIYELEAKIIDTQYHDWNSKEGLTVYEIAFIDFFDLMQVETYSLEDLLNSPYQIKLKSINNPNRKKGIEKAIEKINSIYKKLYEKDLIRNTLDAMIPECPNMEYQDMDFKDELINKLTRRTAITNILEVYLLYHYVDYESIVSTIRDDLKTFRFLDVKNHSRDAKKAIEKMNIDDVCLKGVEIKIGSLPFKKYIQSYSLYITYLSDGSLRLTRYKIPLVRSLKYFECNDKYIFNLNNSKIFINRPLSKEKRIFEPLRDEIENRLVLIGTKLSNAKEIAGILLQTYKKLLKN
ncbi:hypothetical protein [Poseidonibacter ostreae]|jgi:hypothetical protein|uniref:Uncharacterized protein n=1 Tax=Poseidonibacter ostreae TaxID=2654171 RepID=A0A6L4WTU5_9BACT|nr:hypothetical protein [Poseidonibacter ostreae]KAB7887134.1 hypothetical protein GA417_03660 [Poseidonibacter ostreae]KAB7888640.1 hypothetical protein GBG19_08500 [Poseidonibacter ostreae]KAB7892313.1 hypothetical protein GBG18_03420 [Poseidonibacter ostreae]